MSVDRRPGDRFERSITQATESARWNLKIILANKKALLALRGGEKRYRDAEDLYRQLERGEMLTPKQFAYIDGIYESMWRGAGMDSVRTHHDRPRATLRHPK